MGIDEKVSEIRDRLKNYKYSMQTTGVAHEFEASLCAKFAADIEYLLNIAGSSVG